MISVYSFFSSVIFFNFSLVVVFFLRRKTRFLARYTASTLIFLTFLGLLRLFTPVDLDSAYVIESRRVIPAIQGSIAADMPGSGISLGLVLLAVWACGTVLYAARDIAACLKSRRERAGYAYVEDEQVRRVAAGFGRQYTVKVSPDIRQPYTAGVLHPVIYLPCLALSDRELALVLRHEVQHVRSHDGLKKLLFLVIEALFWWNPIAHISMDEIDTLLELQCDTKVIRDFDEPAVLEYMRTMLSVMRQTSPARAPDASSALAFAKNTPRMQQRFEVMLHRHDRKPKRVRILMNCLFVAVFLLSYLVILQPVIPPPVTTVSGYVEVADNDSYILYKDGQYILYFNGSFFGEIPESDLTIAPYNELEIREG